MQTFFENYKAIILVIYTLSFLVLTILFVPLTSTLYVLFAGALFGFLKGVVFFSFLVSIAYTLSFLFARYLINKENANGRFSLFIKKSKKIANNFEKDGWLYLLSLRFAAIIPAFVINIGMGFTQIPVWQFYLVTQIGTLPHVLAYVYAGSKIEELKDLNSIVSPEFFILLIFLSVFPIATKIIIEFIISIHNKCKNKEFKYDQNKKKS